MRIINIGNAPYISRHIVEDYGVVGCDALQSGGWVPNFGGIYGLYPEDVRNGPSEALVPT
jgi:hypothetical protein